MPQANRTTPANGHERAQVLPLLDAVCLRTGKPEGGLSSIPQLSQPSGKFLMTCGLWSSRSSTSVIPPSPRDITVSICVRC
jgi:hypothetical protein